MTPTYRVGQLVALPLGNHIDSFLCYVFQYSDLNFIMAVAMYSRKEFEWGGEGELCDTIYYQGMNSSQVQARKYTGSRDMIATTGERVGCEGRNGLQPIEAIYSLYIGQEIADVDLNPLKLASLSKPIKWGGAIASSISNYQNGFTFVPSPNSTGESVAYHAPNRKSVSIGQETDINSLKVKYKSWLQYNQKTDHVIYYSVSRGTAATFCGLALNPDLAANAKLAIFEGAIDSIQDVLENRYSKQTGSGSLGDAAVGVVNTAFSLYIPYQPNGISPIHCVNTYPENLPSVFITSEEDEEVPCENTQLIAQVLADRGKNDVYLLKLKHSSHPNYMFDNKEDRDTYEAFIHAIYKKYHLKHNVDLAKKGEELLTISRLHPSQPTISMEALAVELSNPSHKYTMKLAAEGVSGTYFILDNKRPIAVYKDSHDDPLYPENQNVIPQVMRTVHSGTAELFHATGFPTACNESIAGQGFSNDIVSYMIGDLLRKKNGFDKIIIPDTVLAEGSYINNIAKEKGVLIQWVDHPVSLEKYMKSDAKPRTISMEAFEQLAVVDYITGNIDRKAGNILLQKNNDLLYLIDNSWAFSPEQGEIISKNQFAWRRLPFLREQHFSSATRDKISVLYEQRYELSQLVFKQFNELKAPNQTMELNFQRAMCFLHRIEMLYHLINVKDVTFYTLGKTRFDYQFLEKHNTGELKLSSFLYVDDLKNKDDLLKTTSAQKYLSLYGNKAEVTADLSYSNLTKYGLFALGAAVLAGSAIAAYTSCTNPYSTGHG